VAVTSILENQYCREASFRVGEQSKLSQAMPLRRYPNSKWFVERALVAEGVQGVIILGVAYSQDCNNRRKGMQPVITPRSSRDVISRGVLACTLIQQHDSRLILS